MAKLLAIDLGKYKSVACIYNTDCSESEFKTIATGPQSVRDLIVEVSPDREVPFYPDTFFPSDFQDHVRTQPRACRCQNAFLEEVGK